jgi:hypothetical protein
MPFSFESSKERLQDLSMLLNGIPEDGLKGRNMQQIINTFAIHECAPCWLDYLF